VLIVASSSAEVIPHDISGMITLAFREGCHHRNRWHGEWLVCRRRASFLM